MVDPAVRIELAQHGRGIDGDIAITRFVIGDLDSTGTQCGSDRFAMEASCYDNAHLLGIEAHVNETTHGIRQLLVGVEALNQVI